eukprot:gene8376-17272_t
MTVYNFTERVVSQKGDGNLNKVLFQIIQVKNLDYCDIIYAHYPTAKIKWSIGQYDFHPKDIPKHYNRFDRVCGDLILYPLENYSGGHTDKCFFGKPIPFEACRLLLIQYKDCSALTYADGQCWLHNRGAHDWEASTLNIFSTMKSVRLHKLEKDFDVCDGFTSPPSMKHHFDTCLTSPKTLNKDFLFHMREGGEIAASAYFIRNSLYSRCFLELWSHMIPPISEQIDQWIPTPNYDNGDLVYTVMTLINETAAVQCASMVKHRKQKKFYYDYGMLRCFRVFRGSFLILDKYIPQIKIYFIREGFFRMHLASGGLKDTSCHKNDILAHGWSRIGTHLWGDSSSTSIKISSSSSKCDELEALQGRGGNKNCYWLTKKEELNILQMFFLQKWFICEQHGICEPTATLKEHKALFNETVFPFPWLASYLPNKLSNRDV